MSLKLSKALDLQAFSQAVLSASGLGALTATVYGNWSSSSGTEGSIVYHQGRDAVFTCGVKTGSNNKALLFRCDPDFLQASGRSFAKDQGGSQQGLLAQGLYNPANGTQRLYSLDIGNFRPKQVNVDTLEMGGDAFTGGPFGAFTTQFALHGDLEGGWSSEFPHVLFFEGLTDGIPGETLMTGPNVYPQGLMLGGMSGRLNGVSFNKSWGWVDIFTTRLTGLLGGQPTPSAFPLTATANPPGTSLNAEGPIGGEEFDWTVGGFIMDADAPYAQPKGELFFYNENLLNAAGTPSPGQIGRFYVRFADFNPFHLPSAPGIVTRTHGRIRLTSRTLIPMRPQFNIAGQDYMSYTSGYGSMAWDPIRSRVLVTAHREHGITGGTTALKHSVGMYSRAVDVVVVSAPAARAVPRTGEVVPFDVFVGGDLGEPAAGQVVEFTLARRSTEGEVVTVSGGIGTTSTLAHPAVDTSPAGVPELALVADGVPLALTTNYTVVAATGVITWVTSQSGKVVLATYNHRSTDAQPPHGTLLASTVQADEFGVARTSVQFPDNDSLVGTLDELTSALG